MLRASIPSFEARFFGVRHPWEMDAVAIEQRLWELSGSCNRPGMALRRTIAAAIASEPTAFLTGGLGSGRHADADGMACCPSLPGHDARADCAGLGGKPVT